MTALERDLAATAVVEDLQRDGVRAIRLLFADLHGVARGKEIPVAAFADLVSSGSTFCSAVLRTDLRQTPVVDGADVYSDLVALPDLRTTRVLPWQPEIAWCLADLWHVDRSSRWPVCPRGALSRVTERFRGLGLAPIVGPESEFFLMHPDSAARCGWRRYIDEASRSYSVGSIADPEGILTRMLDCCERLALLATSANHEFSNSQYEITVGHSDALDAGDRGLLLKTAIKEIAARGGLNATFLGRPFNDQGGSGFHVHISLAGTDGENLFADPDAPDGLSCLAKGFIAGVLEHARGLTAILAPTVNAYKRIGREDLVPSRGDWGYDNRTSFIRIPPERGAHTRIEVRAGDASANPHLLVAALLVAGLDGVERELTPPRPAGTEDDPRARMGTELPRSLETALTALTDDSALVSAVSEDLIEAFVALKRFEVERFNAWVTDWEIDEYARHL